MIDETTVKEKDFGDDFRRLMGQARFIALVLVQRELEKPRFGISYIFES